MVARLRALKARIPAADVGVAALLGTFLVFEVWVFRPAENSPVLTSIAAVLAAGSIAFRRVKPFSALLLNVGALAVLIWLGNPSAFYQWTNLIMVFSIAVQGLPYQRWLGLALSLAGVWFSFVSRPEQGGAFALVVTLAIWTIVWLVGLVFGGRQRESDLANARDAATALALVNQQRLELEKERLAIARELHDLIGHSVNVILVHAEGGLLAVDDDPRRAASALETIASTARQAVVDLNGFLAVMRRGASEQPRGPAPRLESLPRLIGELEDAGISVDLSIHGELADVPDGISTSVFRITQAALTNTLRHAGPASAAVDILVDGDSLNLSISDTGRGLPEDATEGVGLTGIRERVALHGGEVRIGNRPNGGLEVACRFPLGAT